MRSIVKRNISALADKEYDLIVVGGGIFGICAAWDATLRGLSVALLERGDFGHATSANHFKVLHGGIRYLQHADLHRIRESSLERNAFLRIAPHLVQPMPFVIPTYGHGLKGKEVMASGLLFYDLLTLDRNRGLKEPQSRIPRGRIISRQKCLAMFPHLDSKGLTGAAVFYDGQMYNPARLSLSFVKAAAEAGSDVANYIEVTEFIRHGRRIVGVKARDTLSQDEVEVRGRMVLNATGPWAKWLLSAGVGLQLEREPTFSRDAYFVVGRRLIGDYALAVQGQTKDPDAVFSRGNRHLFLVPWRDYTLVGVWHVVYEGKPDEFTVTEQDLQAFLDEINTAYPSLNLTLADVSLWNAGLTLFGENRPGAVDLSYGKRSRIIDHSQEHGLDGLITLIGVRFTTARGVATEVIDLVYKKLGKKPPPSLTAVTPIDGGHFISFAQLLRQAVEQSPPALCAEAISALLHNYGSTYQEVLKYIHENPAWAETVGSSKVIKAEVIHAVRDEMAPKLADVVFRRTDLGTGGNPGQVALRACADLMASELAWPETHTQKELAEVEACFPNF
jgi:glycerol-3-phosphate dehydrogenase